MKRIFFIAGAVILLAGCHSKNAATIDGTVTGLLEGTSVYLIDNAQDTLASAPIVGGAFRMAVNDIYPDMAYLVFGSGSRQTFSFFLEPGTIRLQADFVAMPVVRFSGTDSNDRLAAMNDGLIGYNTRAQGVVPRLIELEGTGVGEGDPQYDSLLTIYNKIMEEQENFQHNAALADPNTTFAAYVIYRDAHALGTPAEMDSVLNLIAGAPANAFTDRLKERREVLAATAVGQSAPDFTQDDTEGNPFTLSSLKGQVVMIDFWASWCGPCRVENPRVVKMYDKYHELGFEIVGVSLDSSFEAWMQGIIEDGLPWIHVSDVQYWNNAVAQQYAVRSIPHTVLLDRNGIIVAKNLRGRALEEAVARTLGVEVIPDAE